MTDTQKRSFWERNEKKIVVASIAVSAGIIFVPQIRSEIAKYRLMQYNIQESTELLTALWDNHPINAGLIEAKENNA